MPTLLHLPYSPWSERARWALDACKVSYQKRTYQPLIGEPELRLRLQKWTGPVSVPLLILPDRVIGDSFEIAEWAHQNGHGLNIFPDGARDKIIEWNNIAQTGLSAGRQLSLARVLQSEAALNDLVPRPLRYFGSYSREIARRGVERTIKKYSNGRALSEQQNLLVETLTKLRSALGENPSQGPKTLLSSFSYADITAAQIMAFIEPPDRKYLKIASATRDSFGDSALAAQFQDLVLWRDALYSTYREITK